MRKTSNLVCRALLVLLGVFLATLPTQAKVYDFENESDNVHWHFINGSQTNKWVVGTSAGSNGDGSSALYVSSGTVYSYANTTSTVWAYCDEALEGEVTISFDWKGTGESSYDYMYAYLIPVSASQPTAGSTTVPTGAIQIGSRFNGQSSWTTFTDETRVLTEQYYLYFMWKNDGSMNGTPIAIDNVTLTRTPFLSDSLFIYGNISDTTLSILKYIGTDSEVAIPTSYNNLPIVAIGNEAFKNKTFITSITIPSSVTSIGNEAFSNSGITDIRFPENVTSIGSSVLSNCPVNYIIASMKTPVVLSDNMIGSNRFPQDVSLVVSQSSIYLYQTVEYWQDFDIKAQVFSSHFCTTQTTARVEATYLTADSAVHGRLGYVFAGDTIWNNDNYSDTVSFMIEGLAHSTTHEFCFVADSVWVDGNTEVMTDSCDGTQWSEWSTSRGYWAPSSSGYYYLSGSSVYPVWWYDELSRTITLEAGMPYTFSISARSSGNSPLAMYIGREGQTETALIDINLKTTSGTYSATFIPDKTGEYTIRLSSGTDNNKSVYIYNILICASREIGVYSQCASFQTQSVNLSVHTETTHTTARVLLDVNCGDVPAIDQCGFIYWCDEIDVADTIFFAGTEFVARIDTLMVGLTPNTWYYVIPFVDINGTRYLKDQTESFITKDIAVSMTYGTPTEATIPVAFRYDFGDANGLNIGINGIEYCVGSLFSDDSDIQTIHINSADSALSLDTIVPSLIPGMQYALRPYVEMEAIGRKYGDTQTMRTKTISLSVSQMGITQTTLSLRLRYDLGDADALNAGANGIEYCLGSQFTSDSDIQMIQINSMDSALSLDTIVRELRPNKQYAFRPYVDIDSVRIYGEILSIRTEDIDINLHIEKITETRASIRVEYDWGDAVDKGTCGIQYCKGDDITKNAHIIPISSDSTNGNITIEGLEPNTQYSVRAFGGYNDFEHHETPITLLSFNNPFYSSSWICCEEVDDIGWKKRVAYYPVTLIKGEEYTYTGTSSGGSFGISDTAPVGTSILGNCTYAYWVNYTFSCTFMPQETGTYYLFINIKQRPTESYSVWSASLEQRISERKTYSSCQTIKTLPLTLNNPELEVVGQTYTVINSTYDYGDATLVRNVLEFKQSVEASVQADTTLSIIDTQIKINNLLPNTTYYFRHLLETIEGGVLTTDWQEFSTKAIALTTQPADGISNTSALLHGTIDCDQESYTEVGFEWKYNDAPENYKPQRLLVTDRVDENLFFRLEGLDSRTWYDFRTFCSYAGETYYGEWEVFRTTSDAVVVAPTVQTVGAEITEQGVEMAGFVVAGTEPMLQQGFEVWVKGTTNVLTTVAEGTIMHAFIPEVRSYTTYQYRAYAKTAAGTTYGATLEIETGYIKQNVQDVTVTPSATEATITWTVVEDAAYYLLTLFADEAHTDTVGVYEVGTDGVITRRNKPGAVQSLVNCLVEELEPDTEYFFSVIAYNAADQKVAEESGWFATELPTSLVFTTEDENGVSAPTVRKILYKGQVLILRDGKAYNLLGQEVR